MKLAISGPQSLTSELTAIPGIEWIHTADALELASILDADGYFYLWENAAPLKLIEWGKPIFFHSVNQTSEYWSLGEIAYRINAWPGFLSRSCWEICGIQNHQTNILFSKLNKEALFVKDQVGMVSARVIAMIVNEAYFALEENISSPEEIDIALKLGTNYPWGPIEWARKIGTDKILSLLENMETIDKRYKPSDYLKKEAAKS